MSPLWVDVSIEPPVAAVDGNNDTSITWVVTHHVRGDRVDQFEKWLRGITEEVKRFPGWRRYRSFDPRLPPGPLQATWCSDGGLRTPGL